MLKTPMLTFLVLLICGTAKHSGAQNIQPVNTGVGTLPVTAALPSVVKLPEGGQLNIPASVNSYEVLARLNSAGSSTTTGSLSHPNLPSSPYFLQNQNYTRGYGFANAKPLKIYDLLLREPIDRYAFYPAK